MKANRWLPSLIVLSSAILTASCNANDVLLILNWGEYINEDLVIRFEEEYNVRVKIDLAGSSELMEQRIKSGTTRYDIVIPSDYMIDKLYREDHLMEIDLDKLTNYNETAFLPGLKEIQNVMFDGNESYAIPYFWGTFGLVYNKNVPGLEEAVKTYGWATMFEQDKTPAGTRVGMYNVPRLSYAAAMMYYDDDTEVERYNVASEENFAIFESVLRQRKFHRWGTDELKKDIASSNLDLAFMYTGDFFDIYNLRQEEGIPMDDMGIVIPPLTVSFFDGMIIPQKARHYDLAHTFIDYFLDPDIAFENASIVGYCTPISETYDMMQADPEWEDKINNYPYYPDGSNPNNPFVAMPLKDLGTANVARLSTIVNNVKSTI
ncbi:MAG: extracellular solute-binding protein [Methanomicrobia archaeon]|nr:extracellular solute-binding protein [Methanomicrobia archaeon]